MAQGSRDEDRSTGGLASSSHVVIAGSKTEEPEQIQKRQILSQKIIRQDIRGDGDNQVDHQGPHRCHLFHVNNLCVSSWISVHGFLCENLTFLIVKLFSIFTGHKLDFIPFT